MKSSTSSVSKGTFIFKNGPSIKQLKKNGKSLKKQQTNEYSLGCNPSFNTQFNLIKGQIDSIIASRNHNVHEQLLQFISDIKSQPSKNLRTAVLLTGINQSDHLEQFQQLSKSISNNCNAVDVILESRYCSSLKSAVESLVCGTLEKYGSAKFKKKYMNLQTLYSWFSDNFMSEEGKNPPTLVIMISDFENFDPHCIRDLIDNLVPLSMKIPLALVLGVATSYESLSNVLPSNITKQMDTNVFKSESSNELLNEMLEKVILNPKNIFHLSGRAFQVLMDIFLFYDYSIHSFVQGYKILMMEQYNSRPFYGNLTEKNKNELEYLRRTFGSFRKLVEIQKNPHDRIKLIKDDKFLVSTWENYLLSENLSFWNNFHLALRILVILFEDLPKNDLGKLLRELYPIAIADDITTQTEYKNCFELLKFTSKEKIMQKLTQIIDLIKMNETYLYNDSRDEEIQKLESFMENFEAVDENLNSSLITETSKPPSNQKTPTSGVNKRQEMLNSLHENAKSRNREVIENEKQISSIIDYFEKFTKKFLKPIDKAPYLHELFFFTDNLLVKRQIVGSPRASIHNALVNSHHYLQCSCCEPQDCDHILPTLPDLAIAYKLHLECNKNINLYDWLQAFSMVKNPGENDITPEIHARFTQCVAELQFLGLIKQAKHKTDHVIRLTW